MADWKTSSEYQGARDGDDEEEEEEVGLMAEENERGRRGAICATHEAFGGLKARFRDSLNPGSPNYQTRLTLKQSASARAAL